MQLDQIEAKPEQPTEGPPSLMTVYTDGQYSLVIVLDADKDSDDRYFLFCNAVSYLSAKQVVRISFDCPEYFCCNDPDGKRPWTLSDSEKKTFAALLAKPSVKYPCTVWTAAKFDWNNEHLDRQISLKGYLAGEWDERLKADPGFLPACLLRIMKP